MKVKHFTENLQGKDYCVGDIHGCFSKLRAVLETINFDESKDRLFSVGDLVDRGPESEESLDWLAKPWFHAVRGNHEQMAIDYCAGLSDDYYSYNGGKWMMRLSKSHGKLFAKAFSDLSIANDITVGDKKYGIIHAEVPVKSWNDLEEVLNGKNCDGYENVAMWSRDKFNGQDDSVIDDVETVYVGHTPLKKVETLGNVIYIDTGACFGGKMTVVQIY